MRISPANVVRRGLWLGLVGMLAMRAEIGRAQLEFTEVMYSPIGDENRWEWIEVRNTSASPINLDGWIFDDEALVALCVGRPKIVVDFGQGLVYACPFGCKPIVAPLVHAPAVAPNTGAARWGASIAFASMFHFGVLSVIAPSKAILE